MTFLISSGKKQVLPKPSVNVEQWDIDPSLVFVKFLHGEVRYQAGTEQKECVNTNKSIVNDLEEVVSYGKIEELKKVVDLGGSLKVCHPVANHDPCDGKGSDSIQASQMVLGGLSNS